MQRTVRDELSTPFEVVFTLPPAALFGSGTGAAAATPDYPNKPGAFHMRVCRSSLNPEPVLVSP